MRCFLLVACLLCMGCGRLEVEYVDVTAQRLQKETGTYCIEQGGVPIFNPYGRMTNCTFPCGGGL